MNDRSYLEDCVEGNVPDELYETMNLAAPCLYALISPGKDLPPRSPV